MAAPKANNSNKKPHDASDVATSFAAFWKSSTVDLPLMLMSESLRFMGHRLQAQADHLVSLTQCKTVSEALESQAAFARTAVSDYASEAGTIMQEARAIVSVPRAA